MPLRQGPWYGRGTTTSAHRSYWSGPDQGSPGSGHSGFRPRIEGSRHRPTILLLGSVRPDHHQIVQCRLVRCLGAQVRHRQAGKVLRRAVQSHHRDGSLSARPVGATVHALVVGQVARFHHPRAHRGFDQHRDHSTDARGRQGQAASHEDLEGMQRSQVGV